MTSHNTDNKHTPSYNINDAFLNACQEGDLQTVTYLLTDKSLTSHANIHVRNNQALSIACQKGHVHIVEYLLTSKQLVYKANLDIISNQQLILACIYGHIGVVNFLLTSDKIKNPSLRSANGEELKSACRNGHLEIVKYLLTSPDLKEHGDVYANNYEILRLVILFKEKEILDYLIYGYNLQTIDERNPKNNLNHILKKNESLKLMFEKRDLNHRLKNNLQDLSLSNQPKHKI